MCPYTETHIKQKQSYRDSQASKPIFPLGATAKYSNVWADFIEHWIMRINFIKTNI